MSDVAVYAGYVTPFSFSTPSCVSLITRVCVVLCNKRNVWVLAEIYSCLDLLDI
jgi:hypothetical protein